MHAGWGGGANKRRGCVNNGVCYEITRLFDQRQRVNSAGLRRLDILFLGIKKKRAFLLHRSLIGWIQQQINVDILSFSGGLHPIT